MRPATLRRLAGLAAIVVMLAIMLVPTLRRYLEQRDQITSLQRSIVEQQRQVQDLSAERARWDDQAYVEQQIRARLHFVKPGETSYTVLDPDSGRSTSVDAKVVGVDLASQDLPWYGQVWSSLDSADRLGAAPGATTSPGSTPHIQNTQPAPATSTPSARPGATSPTSRR
ncbi:FtsB family cell division protein [Arsenicicoccus sp. oral taxon 190]|uniref:FtsB family cell division protein n=1 Tax=Arsenicicoccus sp. oral taxon 190 TaxID=1658671 RepID=UPI00067D4368|nr:septum formation initiator family protein [Arsenicicoccus sp. oral taxon 190]